MCYVLKILEEMSFLSSEYFAMKRLLVDVILFCVIARGKKGRQAEMAPHDMLVSFKCTTTVDTDRI